MEDFRTDHGTNPACPSIPNTLGIMVVWYICGPAALMSSAVGLDVCRYFDDDMTLKKVYGSYTTYWDYHGMRQLGGQVLMAHMVFKV